MIYKDLNTDHHLNLKAQYNKSTRVTRFNILNSIYIEKPDSDFEKRSIKVSGSYIFNSIPSDLRMSESFMKFKIKSKHYFLNIM